MKLPPDPSRARRKKRSVPYSEKPTIVPRPAWMDNPALLPKKPPGGRA